MAAKQYVYRKARKAQEYKAGSAVGLIDAINQVNYGSWFIFLGIKGAIRNIFVTFEKYFFLGSFVLNAFGAMTYFYSFLHASNKNLYKLCNLAIRLFSLSLVLLIMFGTGLIAPTIIMAARITSLSLNPIQFLTRLVYFVYKYLTADAPTFKSFFKSKMIENGLGTLISFLIIAGLVLLFTIPSLPINIMLALSVIGPVVVLGVQTFRLFNFLSNDPDIAAKNREQAKRQNYTDNLHVLGNTTARLSLEMREGNNQNASRLSLNLLKKGLNAHTRTQSGFSRKLDLHRHSIPKAVDITELKIEVKALKKKITQQMARPTFWARLEAPKRKDKLAALEFLEVIIKNFNNIPRSAKLNPVRIDNAYFYYGNIDDLFNKIEDHVLQQTWSKAFQSFFTNISHTESCFQSLCLLLNEKFHPTPKAEPQQQAARRR
jgi:hypothetical protein